MMGYVHSCAIRLRSSSDMERVRDGLRAVKNLPDTIECSDGTSSCRSWCSSS
jgi:hypothetical protein